MVHTLQITMTGSAQQISANIIQAKWIDFQNNAAAVMRIGDKNVTASKGISLAASGGRFTTPGSEKAEQPLNSWYVIGTSTQLLDVTYDDGGA